jgi:hypothetical protein
LGSAEAVVFGVLVFVLGSLALSSAASIVDQKLAVAGDAREAARAYVESDGTEEAWRLAQDRGRITYAGFGRDEGTVHLDRSGQPFGRCSAITVTATAPVDLPAMPVVRAAARRSVVSAAHTEVVDPYRSGLPRASGPCAS